MSHIIFPSFYTTIKRSMAYHFIDVVPKTIFKRFDFLDILELGHNWSFPNTLRKVMKPSYYRGSITLTEILKVLLITFV